jgi:GMP synthase-like glutamine amidotransferase
LKRIHSVQHVPFEPPAHIAAWAEARGHAFSTTRVFDDEPFPLADQMDALVVMGGPMSVHDDERLRWLVAEKRLVADAVEAGLPVLGVCLGAQLIADVSGARVYRNRFREIGWFAVEATREGASHPRFDLPPTFPAFHWHGDTFQLPAGAVHLARTGACEQQMFVLGERVLGIQFHLEVTPAAVAEMVAHGGGDLTGGPFVQPREALAGTAADFEVSQRLLERLLDRWIGGEET